MKVSIIMFSALFAIAETASAERFDGSNTGSAIDARKTAPGIGDAIYSPNNLHDSKISVKGWGTGKGDVKRKMEIDETEKNLRKRPPPPTATPINLPKPPENPATPPGVPVPYPNTGAHRSVPTMK